MTFSADYVARYFRSFVTLPRLFSQGLYSINVHVRYEVGPLHEDSVSDIWHVIIAAHVSYPGLSLFTRSPRTMFWCQVVATVIAGVVQLGVQSWMFSNIPDMCSRNQNDGFVCASTEVFYTATVIWGVVGPNRLFSAGQVYGFLRWFFLFGISPIFPWFLTRRYPNSWFRYIKYVLGFPDLLALQYIINPHLRYRQHSDHLVWHRLDTSCERGQLRTLGHCWLLHAIFGAKATFWMVVQV